MTSSKLLQAQKPRDPEGIILDYYAWLLDWARQLTRGTSEEAEDLVQDLYVRFVQMKSRPELLDDDQIRAYLYKSLRNLFISRRLRNGRDAISGLLVVDFDSVAYAMLAVDRSKLLYVRSDLARICEYSCIRRKSSRAAAALILRFFLGYLPTEAMAILKSKRAGIDALTQTARLEAKAYLERPGVLRFLDRSDKRLQLAPKNLPEDSEALLSELLRRVFSDKEGLCFPAGELNERYGKSFAAPFSTDEIAHLVSCRSCLREATQILALPDLTLQFLPDLPSAGEGGPSAPGPEKTDLKKLRRKLRETYEHRPSKLQIIVDGEVRGVQTITGASSKVQIALQALYKPGFVEILSEQGLGLLYLDLQQDLPEPTHMQQQAEVELSDGRQLAVALTWSEGAPVIQVSYYDPLFESEGDEPPSWTADVPGVVLSNPDARQNVGTAVPGWLNRLRSRLSGWWRLGGILAFAACLVAAAMLGFRHQSRSTTASPNPLLILTQSDEKARLSVPPHGATRSRYSMEVSGDDVRTVQSYEVESLRSADKPLRVVRLRAANGSLIAAQETDSTGKIIDASKDEAQSSVRVRSGTTPLDGTWEHPPDSGSFRAMAGGDVETFVTEVRDGYEVGFRRSASQDQPSIVEARLVIASGSMRAISETLEVQHGHVRREYRFREASYEVLPSSQVHVSDFQPLPSAVGTHSAPVEGTPTKIDTAELVLGVLETLNSQQEQVQDSVAVERNLNDTITISGVVPSQQRQTLIEAIRSLPGSAHIALELHSTDAPQPSDPLIANAIMRVSPLSITDGTLPLDRLLRGPLKAQGLSGSELDERIRESAATLVEEGAKLHRDSWITGQIANDDFRTAELQTMRPDERARWLALLKQHMSLCDEHMKIIAGILAISGSSQDDVRAGPLPFETVVEFKDALSRFVRDTTRLDSILTKGFSLSPETESPSVDTAELETLTINLQAEESRLEATFDRLQAAKP